MSQVVKLDIVCKPCKGTGLYVGMGERDGAAVVCHQCKGTGKDAYRFEYEPFETRRPTPENVTSVHVARGYGLATGHPECDGGLSVDQWKPGMTVPADEQLYCPFLYTHQEWCAKPEAPSWRPDEPPKRTDTPLFAGQRIDRCKHWETKADCWRIFHTEAPAKIRRQVS